MRAKKKKENLNYAKGTFAVVKFIENATKLFECIPDIWFVNDEKTQCFWPPKRGKSCTLRAMNQEVPGDDWEVFECQVISDGHATYSIGCKLVREKVAQNYNTSSADEHIQAGKFRREHPGLIASGEICFENVFTASNEIEPHRSKFKEQNMKPSTVTYERELESNVANHPPGNVALEPNVSPSKTCNSLLSNSNCHDTRSQHSDNSSIQPISITNHSMNNGKISRSKHSSERSNCSSHHSWNNRSQSKDSRQRSERSSHHSRSSRSRRSDCSNQRKNHSESISQHSLQRSSRSRSKRSSTRSPPRTHHSRNNRSRSRNNFSRQHRTHSKSSSHHSRSYRSRSQRSYSSRRSESTRYHSRRNCSGRTVFSSQRTNNYESISHHSLKNQSKSRSKQSAQRFESSTYYSRNSRPDSNYSNQRVHTEVVNNHSRRNRSASRSNFSNQGRIHSFTSSPQSCCYRSKSRSRNYHKLSSERKQNHGSSLRFKSKTQNHFTSASSKSIENRSSNIINRKDKSVADCVKFTSDSRRNISDELHYASNKMRVEAMYKLHEERKAANRLIVQPKVHPQLKSIPPSASFRKSAEQQNYVNDITSMVKTLISGVKDLTNIVNKHNRRLVENDRRQTRMEVTVNKTFIMLGDLAEGINVRALLGHPMAREIRPPKGFREPKLPIGSIEELTILNRDFKNKEFFNFCVAHEREYCTPSSSTHTATITAYLKRFIQVDVRAPLVLKELKGEPGLTLYNDFKRVYLFIIEVMKAGYLIKNKKLTNQEVHVALRIVWGRSKQSLNEKQNKQIRHFI